MGFGLVDELINGYQIPMRYFPSYIQNMIQENLSIMLLFLQNLESQPTDIAKGMETGEQTNNEVEK
jgi:hypothetical protein